MTSEVAVYNRQSVALAADSLVTISTGDTSRKTHSTHKLFTLSKHHPVGFMTYGNASPCNVPWETLVKTCRKELSDTVFGTVEEYYEWFLKRIRRAFSTLKQEDFVLSMQLGLHSFFARIRTAVDQKVRAAVSKRGSANVKLHAATIVQNFARELTKADRLASISREARIYVKYSSSAINEVIRSVFDPLPITDQAHRDLFRMAELYFTRDHHDLQDMDAGIVVAGFGENELFPTIVHSRMRGSVAGELVVTDPHFQGYYHDGSDAGIVPFAQSDVMRTFMVGMDPNLQSGLLQLIGKLAFTAVESTLEEITRKSPLTDEQQREILSNLAPRVAASVVEVGKDLEGQQQLHHIQPLLEALKFMPKEELAGIAEAS